MPHSQKLTELKEFKWALWGPLGAAVIVAIIITVADYLSPESLQFCITSECINDAIYRHKLSLGIAALVFPLVALVASNHRSVQTVAQIKRADKQIKKTNKQIRLTEEKNSFDNYYKHQEKFRDFIDYSKKCGEITFEIKNSYLLYKIIFIRNNSEFFVSKEDGWSYLDLAVESIVSLDEILESNSYELDDEDFYIKKMLMIMWELEIDSIKIGDEIIIIESALTSDLSYTFIENPLTLRLCLFSFIRGLLAFSSNRALKRGSEPPLNVSEAFRLYQSTKPKHTNL